MPIDTRVFEVDEEMGVTTLFHYDEDTGDIHIEEQQDVTDLVEWNKRLVNVAPSGWKGDMHRVASIPLSIYYELKRQKIVDDPEDPKGLKLKKWLEDRDNMVFRTKEGRL